MPEALCVYLIEDRLREPAKDVIPKGVAHAPDPSSAIPPGSYCRRNGRFGIQRQSVTDRHEGKTKYLGDCVSRGRHLVDEQTVDAGAFDCLRRILEYCNRGATQQFGRKANRVQPAQLTKLSRRAGHGPRGKVALADRQKPKAG